MSNPFTLTTNQRALLEHLAKLGPGPHWVVKHTGAKGSLRMLGLIERHRKSPHDPAQWSLTDKGRSWLDANPREGA